MSHQQKRSFCEELDFAKEIDRLRSLNDWKSSDHVDKTAIACIGCYFDKKNSQIKCHFCDRVFYIARESYTRHVLDDGEITCPLICRKETITNVPISKWAFEYQIWKLHQKCMLNSIEWTGCECSVPTRMITLQEHPKLNNKLTNELHQKIEETAEAGFIYGNGNKIVCPCCDLRLGHSSYKTPLEYHAARSLFRCAFLIITHGMRNIDKVVQDMIAQYPDKVYKSLLEFDSNSVDEKRPNCDCAYLIPHEQQPHTWPIDELLPKEERFLTQISDTISLWTFSWDAVIGGKHELIKQYAKYKDFALPFSRRETFIVNRSLYTTEEISIMADNGIFNNSGILVCYCCNWIWKGYDLNMLPRAHMSESNNCYFATYYYGLNAIQSTLAQMAAEEHLDRQEIIKAHTEAVAPPPKKNYTENICKICIINPSNVICIPCGHVCLCKSCHFKYTQGENRGDTCIICRKVVNQYNCCYF